MAKAPAKGGKKKSFKKKEKRNVPVGLVHVQASFNNTIITITDPIGNVLAWSSSGSLGFRGSRKGTPFAAQQASLTAANKARESGLRTVEVNGHGRFGCPCHQGQVAHSAQWVPGAQKAQSLRSC